MSGPSPAVRQARVRVVPIPAGTLPELLLSGAVAADIFTATEAQLCARRGDLTGWAGRLAAKLAVADVIRADGLTQLEPAPPVLRSIEVLPDASDCPDPGCTRSHPPAVHLHGELAPAVPRGGRLDLSISHTPDLAVAVAVLTGPPRPSGDHHTTSEGAPQ